jgi:hypothetical protein
MTTRHPWTLNKSLVVVLLLGFAVLLLDIRSEHADVVRENWKAWIPVVYSGVMLVLGAIALANYEKWGRAALVFGFGAAFIVGGLGFYFHTGGHMITAVFTVLKAWGGKQHFDGGPPPVAPLSFAGLGLVGIMACARGSQPRDGQITGRV